jgi:hypothetical protein
MHLERKLFAAADLTAAVTPGVEFIFKNLGLKVF